MEGITKTVRELDPELWKQARAQAILEGKTLGQWMNEAIRERLERKNKREGVRK